MLLPTAGELNMESGGSRNGEPPPASGGGARRRPRRKRRNQKKGKVDTDGEGSNPQPHGTSDAEGNMAAGDGGDAVQATPPRAGEQSNAGACGGDRGRLNGEEEHERLLLGGLGRLREGRNGGAEEEKPGLARVPPLPRGDQQGALAGGNGSGGGSAGDDWTAGDDAGGGRRGGGPNPELDDPERLLLGVGAEARRDGHEGIVEFGLANLGVPMLGGGGGQRPPMAADGDGVPVPSQPIGAGGGGCSPGRAAAGTSQQLGVELSAPAASPPKLLPRSTFLTDTLLSWTVGDVLDEDLYRDKVRKHSITCIPG